MYLSEFINLVHSLSEDELVSCYLTTKNDFLKSILELVQQSASEKQLVNFIESNQISLQEIKQFQEIILDQVSQSVNSPYVQVVSTLRKCNWLFHHQQFSLCKTYLEVVKKQALQYDYFEILVTITAIEINLKKRGIPISSSFPNADAVKYNRLAINYRRYIAFQYKLEEQRTLVDSYTVRRLSVMLQHELLSDISQAHSTSAQILFYETKGKLHYLLENYEAAYEAVKKMLQLYEDNSHLLAIPAHLSKYISVVGNYFGHARIVGVEEEDRLAQLRKLQELTFAHQHKQGQKGQLALNIFVVSFLEEIQAYLNEGDYEKIIQLIPEIEEGFSDQTLWSYKCVAYRYFAYAHFLTGDYRASLHWIDLLLEKYAQIVEADVKAIMLQVKLIIYFEDERWTDLGALIKETEAFHKKHKRRSRFEQLFINFMQALHAQKKTPEVIYKEYLSLFQAIDKEPEIKHREEYFDIETWIQEKLAILALY